MNILHIHENFEIKGGSEVYIHNIIRSLKRRSHFSELLAIQPSFNGYKINSTLFQNETFCLKRDIRSLLEKIISEYKFTILHIHGISDAFVIKLLSEFAPIIRSAHEPRMFCPGASKYLFNSDKVCDKPFGLHCLAHAYTEMCTSRNPKVLIRSFFNTFFELNKGIKIYEKVIITSEYMYEQAKQVGFPESKLVLLPYFTDFAPSQINNNSINATKRLLFTGRLIKHKGILFLLQSISQLLKERDDVYFDIVGDGPQREEIERFIVNNSLQDKIIMHGWATSISIKKFYEQSYLVFFPSVYSEAFGIVGLEAMAYGKPVIGFDRGGVSTWLKDGVNGYLIDKDDNSKLISSLNLLLDDHKTYMNMSINSIDILNSTFSEEKHISSLEEIYKSIISK